MIVQWVRAGIGFDPEPAIYLHGHELAAFLRDECDQDEAARIVEETVALTEARIES